MSEEGPNLQGDGWERYLGSFRHNLGGAVPAPVLEVDDHLSKMTSAFDNIEDPLPPQLFQIGFASWRAALSLALSGASMQASPLLRHALEAAIYAFLFVKEPNWQDVWLNREIDKKAKEKFRKSGLSSAKARLRKESRIACEQFESTYDHLISFGAHPNVFQFVGSTREASSISGTRYETAFLGSDGARKRTFLNVGYTGICLLLIADAAWPMRFGGHVGHIKLDQTLKHLRYYAEIVEATEPNA